jgi:hypothetical protein
MKHNENPQVSVASLLDGAKGYLTALEVLAPHLNRQLIYPIGLLASQALELALKAVLLNGGWTEDELRNKIGHDLKTVWDEARKEGLKVSWEHKYSVDVLSLSHEAPYLFRYPREKVAAAITEPEVLCRDVKAVITAVEKHVAP